MSEEEQVEQVQEAPPEAPAPQEVQDEQHAGDTLVNALFNAAQDTDPLEEQAPDLSDAMTLNETLAHIDNPPEEAPEATEAEAADDDSIEAGTEEVVEDAPKKKVRRIVKKEIVDPTTQPPPSPEQQAPPEPEPVDPFVDELMDSERELYEMATYAENRMGRKNLGKQYLDFLKQNKEYLEKRSQEDPHFNAEQDEEYVKFVQRNQPNLSKRDIGKIRDEMLMEKAEGRILDRLRPYIDDLQQKQYMAEVMPRVNQAKQTFYRDLLGATPEELHEVIKKDGLKGLSESNPLEYRVLAHAAQEYQQMADYLIEVSAQLHPVGSPEYTPPPHGQKLDNWIHSQQSSFIESGVKNTRRDGKDFARREEFSQLESSQPGKFWTWSDEDLLHLLSASAKIRIKDGIKAKQAELAAYMRGQGQEAPAPQQAAPKQQAPAPTPKRQTPSPRPGGVPATQPTEEKNAIFEVLGM